MFTRIEAKNFLSWENLDFPIQNGIVGIEGFNKDDATSEGSGKSAILNALCWGLFGKIPKDANIDEVIREGEKSCYVSIELSDGSKIFRSRKPNDLFLQTTSGKSKGKDAKETQALVEEKIGFSFETFCQSIYFAQNYPNKFITATEEQKAQIISEIQDLEVFSAARKHVLGLIKAEEIGLISLNKDVESETGAIQMLKKKNTEFEELREREKAEKARKQKELTERMDRLEEELRDLRKQVDSTDTEKLEAQKHSLRADSQVLLENKAKLKNQAASIDQVKATREKLKLRMVRIQSEIDEAKSEIEAYKNPKDKKCKACGTVLEKVAPDHFFPHIYKLDSKIEGYKWELESLKKEHDAIEIPSAEEIKDQLSAIQEAVNEILEREVIIDKQLNQEKLAKDRIALKLSEVERVAKEARENQKRSTAHLDSKLETVRGEIAAREASLSEIQAILSEKQVYMTQLKTLRDGFKEVKQFVFSSLLKELTNRANKYLLELFEVPVEIEFSNTGAEGEISKINVSVTMGGVSRPLGLYSGGQFRRIQFAVDMALSDLISSRAQRPVQLRIFDEYFKDLSESSMEKILRLLEQKKGTTILIEHNSIFKSIINNVFRVELENGVSRVV